MDMWIKEPHDKLPKRHQGNNQKPENTKVLNKQQTTLIKNLTRWIKDCANIKYL